MRRRQPPRVTWPGRLVRGLRPDSNPLRRTSDRIQAAVIAGLVAAFLAGAPSVALAAGHWARTAGLATVRAQQAARHQVPAVLLQGAQREGSGPYAVAMARARWVVPGAPPRTGLIPVRYPAKAGSRVRVWAGVSGRVTGPPLSRAQAASRAVLAAVLAPLVLALLLTGTGVLFCRVLDRHRLAAWEAEWALAGPRWASR